VETTWFKGKWMQLKDITLSEIRQAQKVKGHMFSLIVGDRHNATKYKQYYEEQVMLKGGH
jgi:hypothetical protein